MEFTFKNKLADKLALGLIVARGVNATCPAGFDAALCALLSERKAAPNLPPELEALRVGSRELLRNGRYKPTGRSKPAAEYLLRAAQEGTFPRINGPVDVNNFISLKYAVCISLWDLDLAKSTQFEFALGGSDERFVFNAGGQVIELADLITGYAVSAAGRTPIVTAVKDSLRTKTVNETTNIAASIYYPLLAGNVSQLEVITRELESWLARCGQAVATQSGVCLPQGALSLHA